MSIRFGNTSDIEEISKLWLEMSKELLPGYSPRVDWWKELAYANFKSGVYNIFVVEEDGVIIGFVDFFIFPEPSTGEVHGVGQHQFLKKEFRNLGIGRKLYDCTVSFMISKRVKNIDLCCLDSEKGFWLNKGFIPTTTAMRKKVG